MRTSLDHLPARKQRELPAWIAELAWNAVEPSDDLPLSKLPLPG